MKTQRSSPVAVSEAADSSYTFSFNPSFGARRLAGDSSGEPPPKPRSDITLCLQSLADGDAHAAEELLPLVYDELRRHAAARMSRESADHTLQPTALVHEAWLRLVDGGRERWESRAHFFGAAARAMRRILIESARRKTRLKRGGRQERVDLDSIDLATASPEEQLLKIDEALERLEAQDPVKSKVVLLKFFGGSTHKEVADALEMSERSVERHWAYAKAWLYQAMREPR